MSIQPFFSSPHRDTENEIFSWLTEDDLSNTNNVSGNFRSITSKQFSTRINSIEVIDSEILKEYLLTYSSIYKQKITPIEFISKCSSIKELDFELSAPPELTEIIDAAPLELETLTLPSDFLFNEGFLPKLSRLTKLSALSINLSENFISNLFKACPSLTNLTLTNKYLSDEALKMIFQLGLSLQRLDIPNSKFSVIDYTQLAKLEKLRYLTLTSTKPIDIKKLLQMKNLKNLDLSFNKIDCPFSDLDFSNLDYINLSYCEDSLTGDFLTTNLIKELRTNYPSLTIDFEQYTEE